MRDQNISTLIADGEGSVAATQLLQWSLEEGAIDCVQYSAREKGFTFWRNLARRLKAGGIQPAPHNFGSSISCYTTLHLAASFDFSVEWDIGFSNMFDSSKYSAIQNGCIQIPEVGGFGLELNDDLFLTSKEYLKWE